jgi:nucleoside-diphosphate-sugar epimerase
MPRNYSDTSKAAKMLNWRSETPLEEGLKRTIEDIMRNYRPAANQKQ